MNFRRILLTASSLMMISATAAFAETAPESDYQTLIEKVRKADNSVDFAKLRIAYTHTADYNPYGEDPNTAAMFDALKAKEFAKAAELARLVLEKNYVDIDAHYVSQVAYRMLGDEKNAEFHKQIALGLIDSIASADGSSPETALQVINTREEYIMLNIAGLEPQQQTLQQHGDKKFDAIEVVNPATGQRFTLYFDVTIPFEWLSRGLNPAEKENRDR